MILMYSALSSDEVDSVVYFSDGAPEGLSSGLSKFTSATKVPCDFLSLVHCMITLWPKAGASCNIDTIHLREALYTLPRRFCIL